MHSQIYFFCAIIAVASAGYLAPSFRYAAPAIAYSAPAISYAAPSVAHVEHLAPSYSLHKSEVYAAPLVRTAHIAPAIHAPVAPLIRTGYIGHHAAPAAFGFAKAGHLGFSHHGVY